eukprot:PLAT2484.4.p1 GENE.PLAT2484.4~~PLAT2484.4.p1  ORF type:complete len:359 (-),score=172.66 PLAT2484.4:70-1146(-)
MEKGAPAGSATQLALTTSRQGLASCMLYSLSSISMVLCNKIVLSVFDFHAPFMLLLLQNGLSLMLVTLLSKMSLLPSLPPVEAASVRRWAPVTAFFMAMLWTGLNSLRLLSVTMATVFKNSTSIFVVCGDYLLFSRRASRSEVLVVAVMLLSALGAGLNDLQITASGWMWMSMNCLSTAGYVLTIKSASEGLKLTALQKAYYNNLISMPIIIVAVLASGEWVDVIASPLLRTPAFVVMLFLSGGAGFTLGLSSFWCVSATSPTTYAIVGSLNKVPLAIISALLFGSTQTGQGLLYSALSLAAAVYYSCVKAKIAMQGAERAERERAEEEMQRRGDGGDDGDGGDIESAFDHASDGDGG